LSIKVVKERNGLLITGPRTAIARIEDLQIDIPSAQILFEVLVVDYTTSEQASFGITANNYGADSTMPDRTYYPSWNYSANSEEANNGLRSLERRLGLSNLGVLDDDFFIQLQALVEEGKANLQSRPQIATLNGHTASISIGTTQYYLLESETVYASTSSSTSSQTSQRFETIKANITLEVTPYVCRSGDVIVDLSPEFSTPSGQLDPDIPPTINSRVLKSTVRLKNGETIVLGGLIEDTKSATMEKVPILGSIPILGRIFQNRSSEDTRSELMIYITPHIYYGSEGAVNRDSLIIRK
jgi:type IV pilus assembly protein PilQ